VVRPKPSTRVNALAVAHMLRGIQDGCHTLYELTDMCGLQYQTPRVVAPFGSMRWEQPRMHPNPNDSQARKSALGIAPSANSFR
jgi:hypothetical protein